MSAKKYYKNNQNYTWFVRECILEKSFFHVVWEIFDNFGEIINIKILYKFDYQKF